MFDGAGWPEEPVGVIRLMLFTGTATVSNCKGTVANEEMFVSPVAAFWAVDSESKDSKQRQMNKCFIQRMAYWVVDCKWSV